MLSCRLGKVGLIVLLVSLYTGQVAAQLLDCSNVGFEEGTTRGWVLSNGSVTDINQQPVFQNEVLGIFENGHLITKAGDGNDPKITAEAIPMVAPGSQYSIRIGNVTRGSRFDRIKGSFVVTADNSLFQYRFAVILQNPTHQSYQQPGFSVRVSNQSGATLACSEYDVTAAASITGFKSQGDLRYRNWTAGAIDLRSYIGQTVMIEVTAHGCTERSHFGYAYFDAQCLKTEITQALYCPNIDQTMTLKAPEGFATYRWSNGATTASINIKPNAGDKYQVSLTPYSSLNENCQLSLEHIVTVGKPVEPSRQAISICEGDTYKVGDSTYRAAGVYITRIKRGELICDSLVQTTLTIRPMARSTQSVTICEGESIQVGSSVFRTNGSYQTRLSRSSSQCDSLVTTQIIVSPFSLSITPNVLLRPGDSTQLRAVLVSNAGDVRYSWSPGADVFCPTCATTIVKPAGTTQYTVLAENTTLGCQRMATVLITISNCNLYAPDAFTPNHDGVNDVFYIPLNSCIRLIRQLTVYDRWGEVVFNGRDDLSGDTVAGWDGRYRGMECNAGVYPYKVEVELLDGQIVSYRGRLLLIR